MPVYPLDHHLATSVPRSRAQQLWTPQAGPMPAIYLGHGAPPLLEDELWMSQLFDWAIGMPKPTGILIVSAHWERAPLSLSSTAAGTPLVYDFGGFAQRYYRMTYPTPDATAVADLTSALMPDGKPVHRHSSRGLDHGAWVPLMVMYPLGDVPVVQLSLPTANPDHLMRIGAGLRELRSQGVLIIGSGFLTHGLPYLSAKHFTGRGAPPGWSVEFDNWAAEALSQGDVDELAAFRDRAPGMPYAHPTVEHFSPLFVTLGAATDPGTAPATVIDGFGFGLSKRSIQAA
ncbi:MAG: class III extradiol ring-cleavage dioxygenase [Actinomycetes bacterium]